MAIASTTDTITRRAVNFDTDSGAMGVDNRCLTCMSSQREDFEDDLIAVKCMSRESEERESKA